MTFDTLTPVEQEQLKHAIRAVVRCNVGLDTVLDDIVQARERRRLAVAIGHALGNLDVGDSAEYDLDPEEIRAWMAAGRPAGTVPQAPEPDFSEDPGAVIPDRHPPQD